MVALGIVVGLQAVVTLASAIGLVVYGSRWLEQRSVADRKMSDDLIQKFLDSVESLHDSSSMERKELLDRIQSPLATHMNDMASAVPNIVPLHTEPEFTSREEPDFEDPNLDLDLAIAHARNGDNA